MNIFYCTQSLFYVLILVLEPMQSRSWNSFCASWYWVLQTTCLTLSKPSVSKTGNLDWCSQISSITSISASFEAIVPLSGIFLLTWTRATKALLEHISVWQARKVFSWILLENNQWRHFFNSMCIYFAYQLTLLAFWMGLDTFQAILVSLDQ